MQSVSSRLKQEHSQLLFLDGLRGFAAIYVAIGHARWLLWEGYSEGYLKHPETYSFFQKALMYFFSLFRYGHQMVLFFFVLSGFVIHLKYAKRLKKNQKEKFGFAEYLTRRAKRIYPPFIFALILTLILDSIGKSLGYTIYQGKTPYELINENVGNPDSQLKTLAGNLAFLFRNYIPIFGTNQAAWSLKYEWWFYLLYPLLLLMGRKTIIYPTIIVVIFFAGTFFPAYWQESLSRDVFFLMITWWFGVILAEVYSGRIPLKFSHIAWASLGLLATSVFIRFEILEDIYTGVFFTGLMALLFSIRRTSLVIKSIEKMSFTGDFSYTLYIIHFPILVFFSGWVMKKNNNLLPAHFWYVFIAILLIALSSFLIHFLTEVPFTRKTEKKKTDSLELVTVG